MPKNLPENINQKLVLISEAAAVLGVSIDTVRRWDKAGILHSSRPDGKNRYFSVEELEKIKFSQPLSITEASKQLGLSATTLRRLEERGLIKPERKKSGERIYRKETLESFLRSDYFLRQKEVEEKVLEPLKKTAVPALETPETSAKARVKQKILGVVTEENRRKIASLIGLQRVFLLAVLVAATSVVLTVVVLTALFLFYPEQTSRFLGYQKRAALSLNPQSQAVLGVSIEPNTSSESRTEVLGQVLRPLGDLSLGVVKQIDPATYEKIIPQQPIQDVNDVLTLSKEGDIVPLAAVALPDSAYLKIPDSGLVNNLNAAYVAGKKPGESSGDLAVLGEGGSVLGLKAVGGLPSGIVRSNSVGELSAGILSLTEDVDGTLGIAHGGTGGTTAVTARTALGLAIGTDVPSPKGSGASGTWAIDISGNAGNVSGTVGAVNGGTGKTSWTKYAIPYLSETTAFSEVTIGSAAQVLQVNSGATGYQWHTITAADIGLSSVEDTALSVWTGSTNLITAGALSATSLATSGNIGIGTTATAAYNLNVNGTVYATTVTANLTGDVTGNVSGNAGTVTNGVYTTGSYSDPAWLTISKSKVGLGSVENTALSTWGGTSALTTVGTLVGGATGTGFTLDFANSTLSGSIAGANVSGLTTDDFTSADISQWTNDSNYIAASATITGLVQSTATGLSYFTGGNVGVGTTSPAQALDVNGNISMKRYLSMSDTATNNPYIGLFATGTSHYVQSTNGNLQVDAYTSGKQLQLLANGANILLQTANSGNIVLNPVGNVGIGTTGPGYKLDIQGAAGVEGSMMLRAVSGRQSAFYLNNVTDTWAIYQPASSTDFRLWNGSDLVTFQASGNVGIGTTLPTYKLEVSGSSYFSSEIKAGTKLSFIDSNTAYTDTSAYPAIYATNTAGAAYPFKENGNLILQARNSSSYPRDILFVTGSSNNISMLVDRYGNVGIGTTNPSSLFSVGSSSQFQVNSSGNVTFASTLTPTANYTLGSASYTGTLTTSDWGISDAGALTGISGITNDGAYTQSGTSANTFTGTSTFSNATYSALFTGGNVGIGITAPGQRLEIYGSAPLIKQSSTLSGNPAYTIFTPGGAANAYVGIEGSSGGNIFTGTLGHAAVFGTATSGKATQLVTGNSVTMTLLNSNVGIGTAAPLGKLQIAGNNNGTGSDLWFTYNNSNEYRARIWAQWPSTPGTRLSFGINTSTTGTPAELMVINASGNVGIGTTAPNAPLQVNGNINGTTFNGLTITNNGTNTLDIAAGKTLTVSNSLTLAGTDSTVMTFPSTSATLAGLGIAQTFSAANTFNGNVLFGGSTGILSSGGNIGVGTTAPVATVEVNSAATTGAAFQVDGNSLTSGSGMRLLHNDSMMSGTGLSIELAQSYNAYAYYYDGATYTDRTTVSNAGWVGAATLLADNSDDAFLIGNSATFDQLAVDVNTAASPALTLVVEYASGVDGSGDVNAWTAVSGVSDGTSGFTVDGTMTWTDPGASWVTGKVNTKNYKWLRIRTTTAIVTPPTTHGIAPSIVKKNGSSFMKITDASNIVFNFYKDSSGGPTFDFKNGNFANLNHLQISDPGAGEGLGWTGTTGNWLVDVSPLDRSNADGNLNLYNSSANNIALWRPSLWVYNSTNYATATALSTGGLNFTSTGTGHINFNPGGNVGIGTTAPVTKLTVGSAGSTGNLTVYGTGTTCTIGDGTSATSCSSDARLKTNITTLGNSLDQLMQLNPVTFTWSDPLKSQSSNLGFIAQEVQDIYPELVRTMPDGYLGLDYAGFVVPAVKAIQELNQQVASSSSQMRDLDSERQASVTAQIDELKIWVGEQIVTAFSAVKELVVQSSLLVLGTARFEGEAVFQAAAEFISGVTFKGPVFFASPPTFSSDAGGLALIKKGNSSVEVKFTREYASTPIVTISLNMPNESSASAMLQNSPRYAVGKRSESGFTIHLSEPAVEDAQFSWAAVAVRDMQISVSVPEATSAAAVPAVTAQTISQPLTADQEATVAGVMTAEASASASVVMQLTVQPTELGYLRVRAEYSAAAQEIGQVLPGQTFDILEETSGWFKIEYASGEFGWVSGSYVSVDNH